MECRVISVDQDTDEWLALRRGRITCSRLGDVMARKDTKRYQGYLQEIVLELLGNINVEESPEWARHGRENEPKAIAGYEWKYNVDVEHNVILVSKEYDWLACSPDLLHLPDYNEGGEIKCRALYKNYRRYRREADDNDGTTKCVPAANRHQVQGAMWVTGLDRWAWVNYYIGDDLEGGLTQKIHRAWCPRDQKLIDEMEIRCLEFMTEAYKSAGLQ